MQSGWDDGACQEDQDMLSHDSQSSSHQSRQKTQLPTSLPVMPPIVVCARNSFGTQKSGPVETGPTILVATALLKGKSRLTAGTTAYQFDPETVVETKYS